MSDITYAVFVVEGSDKVITEELNNLKPMLGKKYRAELKTDGEYKLLAIKKIN